MTASSLKSLEVLVIEDDYYLSDDMRRTLESGGATVIGPCRDAVDGFKALEGRQADCALVDLNLGHGPTFEPARRLIELGIPVILVTGYDVRIVPPDLEHVPYLQKPTEPATVIKAVSDLCAKRRTTGAALGPTT